MRSYPRPRRALAALLAVGTLLIATACAGNNVAGKSNNSNQNSSSSTGGGSAAKGSLTISGQNFPEAELVADMYQQLLSKAGYDVTVKLVGTRDVYMKQFPDSVDVVPEYLGGIADFLNIQENGQNAQSITTPDAQETLKNLEPLAKKAGITMLQPSQATDQNAFFVTTKYAKKHSLSTLTDLGKSGEKVVLAAAPDCKGRTDCAGGLEKTYGIKIAKVLPLGYASDQTYQSVLNGESQLGETSTTDGTLSKQGLTLLADDQHIQPAQNLIPAVSTAFLNKHPDVADTLNKLMATLNTQDLTTLNGKVSNQRQKPEDVAKAYLQSKGLL
ncbi:MAG TPA: ABC transporter substrate-binding protein [Nocardioidaceae bacterium]|nr:ABC transporter substrate-binding protein [Nocardioidaceae bacterium]